MEYDIKIFIIVVIPLFLGYLILKYRGKVLAEVRKEEGVLGWPNPKNKPLTVYDPLLYFLDSAKKSLDIFVTVNEIEYFIPALAEARKRGVLVRVILDHHFRHSQQAKDMQDEGIPVFYVYPDIIRNCNYAVKDYSNGRGYACVATFNWSYYDMRMDCVNILFTSSTVMTTTLHLLYEEKLV